MVARFWEHDFYAIWPTKRSRAAHLFVRGAGATDASLCGLATETGSDAKPASRDDLICTRCHYKARHWDHKAEPLKRTRKVVKNTAKAKATKPKTKLKPLPILKAPKKLNWDEITPGTMITGCRVIAINHKYVLLEEEPTTHLYLMWGKKQYVLHTPWIYYYVMKENAGSRFEHYRIYRLFSSPKRITKLDQSLYKMPFPNQYQHGLCYNGSASRLAASQGIADAINIWWNQTANGDNFPHTMAVLKKFKAERGLGANEYCSLEMYFEAWEKMGERARKLTFAATRQNVAKLFPDAKKKDLNAALDAA